MAGRKPKFTRKNLMDPSREKRAQAQANEDREFAEALAEMRREKEAERQHVWDEAADRGWMLHTDLIDYGVPPGFKHTGPAAALMAQGIMADEILPMTEKEKAAWEARIAARRKP